MIKQGIPPSTLPTIPISTEPATTSRPDTTSLMTSKHHTTTEQLSQVTSGQEMFQTTSHQQLGTPVVGGSAEHGGTNHGKPSFVQYITKDWFFTILLIL